MSKIKLALLVLTLFVSMLLISCPNPGLEINLSVPAGTYNNDVTTKVSCALSGVNLLYTLDGSVPIQPQEPNEGNGKFIRNGSELVIKKSSTLKLFAYKKGAIASSLSAKYLLVAAKPTFSPEGGSFSELTKDIKLSCSTIGATIYYTLDKSDPIAGTSATIKNGGTITLTDQATLKAIAIKEDYANSVIKNATFSLAVAEPTFNPEGGSFIPTQEVSISCATSDAQIYYTKDGTPPTSESTLYTNTITLNTTTTLKAIAIKADYVNSTVKSAEFKLRVAEPTLTPDGSRFLPTQEVSISCVTTDAMIYYTKDGSEPTSTSLLYTAPITLNATTPLKTIAIKEGYANSTIKSAIFTLYALKADTTVQVVTGLFNNGVSDVTVSTFNISPYEVTQADYQVVMGTNPSDPSTGFGDDYPVNIVTWYDAVAYCNALSSAKGYTPCYSGSGTSTSCDFSATGYRLPTEAEWQFAAMGGNSTHGYLYSGSNTIGSVAWYTNNSDTGSGKRSHLVGTKAANELEIYDMSGNLYEWCWDWLGDYPSGAQIDPVGAASGTARITRGGYWNHGASNCRVNIRISGPPAARANNTGFRIVRRVP